MPSRKKAGGEGDQGMTKPELSMKKWTSEGGREYYGKVRVEGETYGCGECVAMETDVGM